MASFDWGAFAKGSTGEVLDSWKEREKVDRTMQMQRELEKLRRETSDYEFNRDLGAERKKVSRSQFDPETGEVVDYNMEGTAIGRRRDRAAQEEYEANREKARLDNLNTQSQIAARTRGLELEAERNAISREGNTIARKNAAALAGQGRDGSVGGAASDLMYVNKATVDALIADGIPAEEISRAARLSITHAANPDGKGFNPDRADSMFLDTLSRMRSWGTKGGTQEFSLDSYVKRGK